MKNFPSLHCIVRIRKLSTLWCATKGPHLFNTQKLFCLFSLIPTEVTLCIINATLVSQQSLKIATTDSMILNAAQATNIIWRRITIPPSRLCFFATTPPLPPPLWWRWWGRIAGWESEAGYSWIIFGLISTAANDQGLWLGNKDTQCHQQKGQRKQLFHRNVGYYYQGALLQYTKKSPKIVEA